MHHDPNDRSDSTDYELYSVLKDNVEEKAKDSVVRDSVVLLIFLAAIVYGIFKLLN